MRVIAHSPSNNTSYVIDTRTQAIEWASDREACEVYLKYMTFHDFYYSVHDKQGRSQVPSVTMDYRVMMDNNDHLYPASGWWEKPMIPTLGDPIGIFRFIDCTSYYYP